MARWAANKAERAADGLEAFLRDRPVAAVSTDPGQRAASAQEGEEALSHEVGSLPQRARQADFAAVQVFAAGTPLRSPHTDWLFHRLMVTGSADTVAALRAAAMGAGTIPWRLDVAWLWQHWDTTQALRHVAPDAAPTRAPAPKLAAGEDRLQLSFWSADWSPWRALEPNRVDCPILRFDLQPHYDAD